MRPVDFPGVRTAGDQSKRLISNRGASFFGEGFMKRRISKEQQEFGFVAEFARARRITTQVDSGSTDEDLRMCVFGKSRVRQKDDIRKNWMEVVPPGWRVSFGEWWGQTSYWFGEVAPWCVTPLECIECAIVVKRGMAQRRAALPLGCRECRRRVVESWNVQPSCVRSGPVGGYHP